MRMGGNNAAPSDTVSLDHWTAITVREGTYPAMQACTLWVAQKRLTAMKPAKLHVQSQCVSLIAHRSEEA